MQAGNEFHTTHVNNPNQKELSIVSFEKLKYAWLDEKREKSARTKAHLTTITTPVLARCVTTLRDKHSSSNFD